MDEESGISGDLADRFEKRRQTSHTGTLVTSEDEAYVGDAITLKGRNLPASEPLDVVWKTADGHWGILQGNEIVGPQFTHDTITLGSVATDESGSVTEQLEVPEDYGGEHTIELRTADQETVAEAAVEVVPWFELDQTAVPLGETFTVTGYGLGPNMITNNYQVAWDNGMVGFMTGTMNRGTATAEIRAVAPVGDHLLQVWRNLRGVPFLQNNTQSPFGPVAGGRQSHWTVEVTDPETEPETAWMDSLVQESPLEIHIPDPDVDSDADLSITPRSGQPGTAAFIEGRNFPANEEVDLIWYTHVGNRVAGDPITPEPRRGVLPTVTTDESGEFEVEMTIPDGMGATRPIVAEVGGQSVATTGFMMQPKILDFTPAEGPVGTTIEIELTGVGWPMYENAYYFVYDNRPLGYACGVDMEKGEGIVSVKLQAAGEPGIHFLDLYPSFFEMQEDLPDFQHKAHLSYRDNHPVRPLPALHFTFEVTE